MHQRIKQQKPLCSWFLHSNREKHTTHDKPNMKVNYVAYLKMIYAMERAGGEAG